MKHRECGLSSSARQWMVVVAVLTFLASPGVAAAGTAHIHPAIVTGGLSPNATLVFVNQPVTFTVEVSDTAGPPPASNLAFGDGGHVVIDPPYPQFEAHAYAAPGVYTAVLTAVGVPGPVAQVQITVINPASFILTASPSSVIAGQAVNFTAVTSVPVMGAFVDFGDGTSAPAPNPFTRLIHRYSNPSLYTARLLIAGQGNSFAQTQVAVSANPVSVPIGQIYSSFLVGSPVMAGQDTSIALTFRMFTPFAIGPVGISPLQAIVELADMQGRVVQRSDPFALPFTQDGVNSIQTTMIPYTVPVEAGGNYLIRVYVRSVNGGTVAVARAQPIVIIGGPDPAPTISNQFHASGAVLTNSGPTRGGYNVNLGITTALQWSYEELLATGTFDPVSKRIDPLLTFQSATPAPVTAPAATSAPNSSNTSVDTGQVSPPPQNPAPAAGPTAAPTAPVTAPPSSKPTSPVKPEGSPSPQASPHAMTQNDQPRAADAPPAPQTATPPPAAAQPAPAAAPPPPAPPAQNTQPAVPSVQFKDVAGRTDASLPAIIGNKETLRGIDATYNLISGWTFQGGGGWFQLPSESTTERTGGLLDITKTWNGGNESFRVAYSDNQDNVNKFVPTGSAGPLSVSAGVFELTKELMPHIKALLTGGMSSTRQMNASGPNLNDSVGKEDVNYSLGSTTIDLEYHNAGPQFGTLSGATALTDRAGGAAAVSLAPSSDSAFQFNYGREYTRSLASATSTAVANFNITPPKWPGIALTLERDTAQAPGTSTTTKTANLGLTKSGISSISITGTVAAVSDALAPENYSVSRTGVFQYQYANGPHNFGAGLNATNTTSVNPTSSFTESLNYGFTFGGKTPPNTTGVPMSAATRNFELKLVLTNVNARAVTADSHTDTLTGLLSWHLTPQLAPGIEGNYVRIFANDPAMDSHTSFLRVRLDVNI